jgi:hypothetical protein
VTTRVARYFLHSYTFAILGWDICLIRRVSNMKYSLWWINGFKWWNKIVSQSINRFSQNHWFTIFTLPQIDLHWNNMLDNIHGKMCNYWATEMKSNHDILLCDGIISVNIAQWKSTFGRVHTYIYVLIHCSLLAWIQQNIGPIVLSGQHFVAEPNTTHNMNYN